jgi:succinyl-diaminopimelate desuccinylase
MHRRFYLLACLGIILPDMAATLYGALPRIEVFEQSPQGVTLRWSGGQGPFAVERADAIPAEKWDVEVATAQMTATVRSNANSAFYRIVDLGPAVPEVDAYLVARTGDRFLRDLASLVSIPTFRDDSPDSEQRVTTNLRSIQAHLQARIDSFNDSQRTLQINPFEWRAEVQGVTRWVFGFRVGDGPRKFSMFTHLDTVPPGEESWQPFSPRIENLPYRGSAQDFLIGRGAIDDKGPAVIALSVLEAAAKRYDGGLTIGDMTLEVAFDTAEETDFNIPAYLDATGPPELGIVFDAFWAVRAEKGVERPVFHLPVHDVEDPDLSIVSLITSPGPANQIADYAIATIGGNKTALEAFSVSVSNRYETFVFDDPAYRRAPLTVTRRGSNLVLKTTVVGAQHGSAPAENRANGANPLVSLANFLAGLVDDGILAANGHGRLAQFIAWGWGTFVFGEKHPELLQRSDGVFSDGNGTSYALTQVTTNGSSLSLAIDIRYAQGHQSIPWDCVSDGQLAGTSLFPEVLSTLVRQYNSLHADAQMTFETINHSYPDIRNPESEKFRRVRSAYEEVVGTPCPLFAIGGGSDAHGYPNLIAAGALFSADFDPPVNYHGILEGAPIQDLRLSARILWQLLLRQIEDPEGNAE